ncbi:MAG: DsrE family protein [Actinomycetes bacterium]
MTRPQAPRILGEEPGSAPVAHRVVWQVADGGVTVHERLLRNLTNLLDELQTEGVQVEVVTHGAGLDLLLANGRAVDTLGDLGERGVVFLACENTMRRKHLASSDLVPGVQIVPSGVAEVVRRQSAGWGYLRA